MTHIARIRGVFDVANSQRYRAGFAPMLFQWSHAHIVHVFRCEFAAIFSQHDFFALDPFLLRDFLCVE